MENMGNIRKNIWGNCPVLITGGAGFIGSWLSLKLLGQGAKVFILDIKKYFPKTTDLLTTAFSKMTYIRGDVRNSKIIETALKENKIRVVFHLAAQAIVGEALLHPAETFDTNVKGTWTLLEACRKIDPAINIIVASSDKAYGDHPTLPYKEKFPLYGENPYDCSKSCADRMANTYARVYGLRISVTRCGNVYGGGDLNFSRLIPDTIRSLLQDRAPEIRSDGLYRRDYVYVADIATAYMKTAEALMKNKIPSGEAFNFGTNRPRTALEVVQKIAELTGRQIKPVILATANYEIRDQYLDSGKARKILNWSPVIELGKGLRDTIRWYSEYFPNRKFK